MTEIDKDKMKVMKNMYPDILTLEEKGILWDAFKSKFKNVVNDREINELLRTFYIGISEMIENSEKDYLKGRNKIIFGDENADNI